MLPFLIYDKRTYEKDAVLIERADDLEHIVKIKKFGDQPYQKLIEDKEDIKKGLLMNF